MDSKSPRFIDDDEVIADSEDEESSMLLVLGQAQKIQDTMAQAQKIPAAITQDAFPTPLDPTRAKPTRISGIDDTTPSESGSPKPRPLKKPNVDNTSPASNLALSSDNMNLDLGSSNIADRAKMRSRNAKSQPVVQALAGEIIELSSDDDDDFNISTTSKSKRKSADKAKPKAKTTTKSKLASNGVDTPDPKPSRPRLRPIQKKATSDPASPHLGAISQDTSHVPTSSLPNEFPIPFKLLPSQLPPSDPPTSTSATHDLPHIETLPHLNTDQEPPSSPSSLFSISSKEKNRRKYVSDNVDELDSSQPSLESRIHADTRRMPPPPVPGPPPTFFAGSSSSASTESSRAGPNTSADLAPSTKKTPATKKSRKKKIIESDDEDDTWGASKPKAKPKAKKPPAKKIEVVIARPKAKGKGKEKEIFKSREFINDENDKTDELNLMDTSTTTNFTTRDSATELDSMTSLSSVPDSDIEDARVAGMSKKRKSVDREDYDDVGNVGGDQKRRATGGKGKRVVVSDDDDEDMQIVDEISSKATPAKPTEKEKGKHKEKGKAKGLKARSAPKPVVADSDEDAPDPNKQADEELDEPPRTSAKENVQPFVPQTPQTPLRGELPSTPAALFPSLSSRYTIAPKTRSTPMSDLIRRVNSKPGSPFCSPAPRAASSSGSGARPLTPGGTAYSPYVKSSRSALSRIAPLHPNRRTPPPPLPPPPPKKKTKKELEREEQWEEELVESVGGITEWACMSDAERRELRRAKREREMAGWED
ncbi:hypothetical protein DXG03_001678 [Asterophora parasitica]|uniref:Uncharacterized protein n=1 Tax=Asterophora parasitica TaxID=117018 RepID=A0A9P7GCR4_9AGAR|nr:hypothetical protein DXG03_001678 [Asterophora parasitica]